MTKKDIKIRVGNKVVGSVVGKLFIKRVNGSYHFLHVPPAISFDEQSLIAAKLAGATDTMIIDKETGNAYCAPISLIYEKGFKLERGYGKQIALGKEYWTNMKPASVQPPLFDERKESKYT